MNDQRVLICLALWSLSCMACGVAVSDIADASDRSTSVVDVTDFGSLCRYAEAFSKTPFQPAPELPKNLKSLDYDDYRLISFWPNEAVWRRADTPFQLELFHRGYIFFERVGVNLLTQQGTTPLVFDPSLYEYRGKLFGTLDLPPETGYAGVKMLGTLPSSPHMQEVASFLGASYFRCLSDGQVYGASSRGLGVNMGMPQPEEFPCFREFWVTKPASDGVLNGTFDGPAGSGELHFLAFLDSPSLTGAYEFHLRPGHTTACDVKARLFYRHPVPKLCLAPTSSMWMWGKGRAAPTGDTRPEVHDSDGLLIVDGDGQRSWRALAKQSYPSVSSQAVTNVRGFGLLQRERDYERYQDDEAKYHARPSLWVEPLDGSGEPTTWPAGWIELFEMPAEHEGYDNIAAWFVPKEQGKPGQPFDLHYRVTFVAGEPERLNADDKPKARATDMHVTREGELTTVSVTFAGEPFRPKSDQSADRLSLSADVSALRGSVRRVSIEHPQNGQSVLTFAFDFDGNDPVELKASLRDGRHRLTETWSYLCPPSQ